MGPIEYQRTQDTLMECAGRIAALDLDAFVAAAEQSHTAAAVIDPTLWMAGHARLEAVIDLARAAATVRASALKAMAAFTAEDVTR